MIVDFEEKDLKSILKSYIDKEKNVDCDVNIRTDEIDYDCSLTFAVETPFKVLDKEYNTVIELSEGEVYEILETIFSNEGYEVRNIIFNKGISSSEVPYFDGVTLCLAKMKNITKSIGRKK